MQLAPSVAGLAKLSFARPLAQRSNLGAEPWPSVFKVGANMDQTRKKDTRVKRRMSNPSQPVPKKPDCCDWRKNCRNADFNEIYVVSRIWRENVELWSDGPGVRKPSKAPGGLVSQLQKCWSLDRWSRFWPNCSTSCLFWYSPGNQESGKHMNHDQNNVRL